MVVWVCILCISTWQVLLGVTSNPLPLLRIDSYIEGRPILYPGERASLVYKISFNRNIDLSFSELPFGNLTYIKKIGDVHIQEEQVGEISVQKLIQNIEAVHPGHFLFGPASLTGYTYTLDLFGHKQYQKKALQAKVSALEMQVIPFPEAHKPPSFQGSLGKVEVQLLSPAPPSRIRLGEEIKLSLLLSGITNPSALPLSFLNCQPGLAGFFKVTTRLASSSDQTKREVDVLLEPLSLSIQELPALVFSSFDPATATYHSAQTPSFPLQVEPMDQMVPSVLPLVLREENFLQPFKNTPLPPAFPPFFPSFEGVEISFLKTPYVLWIVPIWLLPYVLRWLKRWKKEPPPPEGIADTVAVFDFDCTITDRDSLLPFLYFCFGRCKTWYQLTLLLPSGWRFYRGVLSRTEVKEEILTAFFQGIPYDWIAAQGALFARTQLEKFVRAEALERLAWHVARNDRCLLVSASIEAYLLPWAKAHGFEKVLCSRLACSAEGRATGRLKGENCWGEEKKRRLLRYLQGSFPTALYVYGDSAGDLALLDMATHPFYRSFSA